MAEEKSPEKINYGTELISWKAPEFIEHKRGPAWIGVMSILAISLIAWGIFTDSPAFAIVIVLLAGVFFLTHNHKPKVLDVAITDAGIKFGDKFHPYEEIRAFWIIFDPPHVKTLNFKISKGVVKDVSIQLEDQNPGELRTLLSAEVPEWKNRTETLSEVLIRLFKL